MLVRKFSGVKGIVEDDRFTGREASQLAPTPVFHEPGKIRKLTAVDSRYQKVETQALKTDDGDFLVDFLGLDVRHFFTLCRQRIREPEVNRINKGSSQEDKINEEDELSFFIAVVDVKSGKSHESRSDKDRELRLKTFLCFRVKEGLEIVPVTFEDQEKKDENERETDGKEGGRSKSDFESSAEEKLKDKEGQKTEKADNYTIGYKKKESELEEEKRI